MSQALVTRYGYPQHHDQRGGGFSNSGTINNTGALTLNMAQSPGNVGGSFSNSGALSNWGTISNSGVFTNSGAVLINRTGLFTTSTNYTQTAGSTFVNGTLTATSGALVDIHGGVLGATGTINGNTYSSEHGSGDPHMNWDDKPLKDSKVWQSHRSAKPQK